MKKLLAVLLAGALCLGMLAAPAWGAETKAHNDGQRAAGKVKSINGNTFVLTTRKQGEIKVQHDGKTEWIGGKSSDLKVGSMVGAAGPKTGDVLHAAKIVYRKEGAQRKARARRHIVRGEITSMGDGSFVMKTRKGPITVKFNEDTRFKGGTSSNLKVGARVGVVPQGCPKKPGVNPDQDKVGARARFCIDASKPGAKVSAGATDGERRTGAKADTAPRTITARGILFPSERTAEQQQKPRKSSS